MDVRTLLSRTRNPFFQHAEAEYILAERSGGVVGRIAAIRNDAHALYHPDEAHVGFFGFFECADDQSAADALFAAASEWLRARGLTVMRGPASFSMNDECGLLVDGFDTPPAIMNPHNPRYYVALVERAGFAKAMDLYCYESTGTEAPARLVEGARRMAERFGITLRAIDMKHFWEDVDRVKQVYARAWEKNWGHIPMTDAEVMHMAKALKPVVIPELIVFAFRQDELIGIAIAIPDFNVVLRHNPSGRLLTGLWHLLTKKKSIRRLRVLTLGVLKEYRRSGADALMYDFLWAHGRRLGYEWGEASWILENNIPMRNGIERLGFRIYKTLRMYQKSL